MGALADMRAAPILNGRSGYGRAAPPVQHRRALVAVGPERGDDVVERGEKSGACGDDEIRRRRCAVQPGDDGAGLRRDEAACGEVPRLEPTLEVPVDPSARD